MESNKTVDDNAMGWQSAIAFAERPSRARSSLWEPIVLAVVCFLHAALIAYVFYWQKDFTDSSHVEDSALQVSFIDRIYIPEKEPLSSSVDTKKRAATTKHDASSEAIDAEQEHVKEIAVPEHRSLRLTMDVDEWKPATVISPRDPLKRQYIAVPGRAEPFIHGIKLADRPTPEQRLQMVGSLFGRVDHDPCKEARNRMASGQSQVDAIDVQLDLRNIELHCRP